MEISVSSLSFMGLDIGKMTRLPKEIGIEIFSECGNDYYWEHWLPRLLEGRSIPLSVHAPFQNLDLADPDADFEEIRRNYRWAFALCEQYGARHCVCHPYERPRPADETAEERQRARQCSLERVLQLTEDAKGFGVELLVENMPCRPALLDQKQFMELFGPHQELNFLIDTGHAHLLDWDMMEAFRTLGTRIKGYHLHDNLGDWDSHLHVWQGSFDWDTFFAGYARYTPDAALVCEYNEGTVESIVETVTRIREQITAQTQGKK